ncbi:MAG: hypothetical protein WKG52_02355 [Variovorax sp.]
MTSPQTPSPATQDRPGAKDEPEIAFEESIPSDGKDPVGEKMIDDLGRDKLNKPNEPKNEPPAPSGEPMPEQLPVS